MEFTEMAAHDKIIIYHFKILQCILNGSLQLDLSSSSKLKDENMKKCVSVKLFPATYLMKGEAWCDVNETIHYLISENKPEAHLKFKIIVEAFCFVWTCCPADLFHSLFYLLVIKWLVYYWKSNSDPWPLIFKGVVEWV